jgi:hypothetical protein
VACAAAATPAWAGATTFNLFGFNLLSSDIDTPDGNLCIKIQGDVSFAPGEDDITALSDKAIFEERRKEHVYRIVFTAAHGEVARTYTIDGKEHAWDADGKRWLAGLIPAVLRETAFDVKPRSKRIYGAGGAKAVLDEIDLIHSEFARRSYIVELTTLGKLDDKQMARLLAAAGAINSDFERRTAYVAVIEHQALPAAAQADLLRGVAGMHSDFEERTVLTALAPRLEADDQVAQAWLGAMRQVHSDFEARTAVVALADNTGKAAIQVDLALQSTQAIHSAFERRTALVEISRNMAHPSAAQVAAYAASARRIDSDFERRVAIVALAEKAALDKNGCLELLSAIDGMGSDFEIRVTLVALAGHMPRDEDVISRYRHVARKLGDFERGQAEKALDRFS